VNVKLGDVAIVIKGRWPNVGKIVYVARETPDRDYSNMGYGILHAWFVESLGGDLDTDAGPRQAGYTPDISLRRLPGITPEQAEQLRDTKRQANLDAVLADLAKILAPFIEEEETADEDSRAS